MTLAAPDFNAYENFEATLAYTEILESYGQCLDMSRDYLAANSILAEEEEIDIDLLEGFLHARADLFQVAESSFTAIHEPGEWDATEKTARQEMTKKVKTLLEEMTEVEQELSDFLGGHLEKMRNTLRQMKQAQPVFKRYGHLGGNKIVPSRINRHS